MPAIVLTDQQVNEIFRGVRRHLRTRLVPQPVPNNSLPGYWTCQVNPAAGRSITFVVPDPRTAADLRFLHPYRLGARIDVLEAWALPIKKGTDITFRATWEGHPAPQWRPAKLLRRRSVRLVLEVVDIGVGRLCDEGPWPTPEASAELLAADPWVWETTFDVVKAPSWAASIVRPPP